MRWAVVIFGLAAAVLGYGWWHAETHATFHMSVAEKGAAGGRYGQVLNAQVVFLDERNNVLARGQTDGKFGAVWVRHPTAGYCGPDLAQPAYKACFDAQAAWLHTWVPRVRRVSLVVGNCRLELIPLQFSTYTDSVWTWWIPLPHVGGNPYTNYSAHLEVDSRVCAVTRFRG